MDEEGEAGNLRTIRANRNPNYGGGIYRRRIRLVHKPAQIVAELEDTTHGFRLTLSHNEKQVINITAEPIRYPFDTCPGAVASLQPLINCPLDIDSRTIRRVLNPGRNCTHLYDLALLALAHCRRPEQHRIYDISVPDERENGTGIRVSRDGLLQHEWQVNRHHIAAPSPLAGKPLMRGFYSWASAEFSDDALEAACVLQRGYFVAQSRRHDYMNAAGRMAREDNMPDGACYTYSAGVVEHAVHTGGMGRDFTAAPDQLLKFV